MNLLIKALITNSYPLNDAELTERIEEIKESVKESKKHAFCPEIGMTERQIKFNQALEKRQLAYEKQLEARRLDNESQKLQEEANEMIKESRKLD